MNSKNKQSKLFISLLVAMVLSLSLVGCGKSTEALVKEKLESYEEIAGNKDKEFNGLEFKVNSDIETKSDNYYPVDEDTKYPIVTFDLKDSETDFIESSESTVKLDIKNTENKLWDSEDEVSEYSIDTEDLDGTECFEATYTVELKDEELPEDVLSPNLKVDAFYIPTHSGLYKAAIYTYQEDENDYKFDDFIESFKIKDLQDYTNNQKQERLKTEELDKLKSQINAITCLDGANEQEKQIFDTRKQEALRLIANRASTDEINAAKEQLNTTNSDIQARIDRDKAAAEEAARIQQLQQQAAANAGSSQSGGYSSGNSWTQNSGGITGNATRGYYCVDGTYVGMADPHAKGRANACYGHGGFAINH